MARKKKKGGGGGGAAWLITYGDMMTLMLTFFVLLVSMATFDERRKLVVLGSIIGTFGVTERGYDPRTKKEKRTTVEPGPMEDVEDLEPLKDLLWEELKNDLDFQKNKFVQVLSINDDVLFQPGSAHVSDRGTKILRRMLPVLLEVKYPLLLAGHTAILREEQVDTYKVDFGKLKLDPSWLLSFHRTMSIYRFFLEAGMPPERLRVEAFGKFRPRFTSETHEGRRRNRRVDIILDRRNQEWFATLERATGPRPDEGRFLYKDFIFDISAPNGQEQGG